MTSRTLKSAISLAMAFLMLALAPCVGGYRAFADPVLKSSTGRSSNTRWIGAPGGYGPAVGVEDPYNFANELSLEVLMGRDSAERFAPYQPMLSQDNVVPGPDAILDDSGLVIDPSRPGAHSRYNVLGQQAGAGVVNVVGQPGSVPISSDRVQRLTSGEPLADTVSNLGGADTANTLEKMWTAGASGVLQSNLMKGVVSAFTGGQGPAWLGLKARPAAGEAKAFDSRFNVESLVLNGSGNGLANGVVAQTISAAQKQEIARVVMEVDNVVAKSGNDKALIYQTVIDRINSIPANRLGAPIPDLQNDLRNYLLQMRDNKGSAVEFKTLVGELFKSVSSLADTGKYSKPIFNPLLMAASAADEAAVLRPTGLTRAIGEKKSFYQESYREPAAPKAALTPLDRRTADHPLWTLGLGSLVVASFAFAGAQATLLAAAGAALAAWMFRPKLAAAPAYYLRRL